MKLREIAQKLELRNLTPEKEVDRSVEVSTGHAGDLLSNVLAHASPGGVLVTVQVHLNVIAVSMHADLKAVIFAGGMVPEESVRQKAMEEGLILYSTHESTFDTAGRLYALGLRGRCV